MVGLPDAAKIAGDSSRTTQVDIRAVGALGVEGIHVAGADDLHGSGDGRQVAVGFLFLHLADLDEAPRHQHPFCDRAFGDLDDPGEILAGADLQGDGEIIGEAHRVSPVSHNFPAEGGDADERLAVALLLEPAQILQVFRVGSPDFFQQVGELAGLLSLMVDLFRCAVFSNHFQEVVDDLHVRIEENGVDVIQAVVRYFQQLA